MIGQWWPPGTDMMSDNVGHTDIWRHYPDLTSYIDTDTALTLVKISILPTHWPRYIDTALALIQIYRYCPLIGQEI